MGCTHNNLDCGCKDTYLTTPPPCPAPEDCPDAQPCSEAFGAQCIFYTGEDVVCGQDTVVATNTNIADAINDIVDYFCNAVPQPAYQTIVQAGSGIDVTSNTVNNVTTYTVSMEPLACPMTVEITVSGTTPRALEATVTGGVGPYTYDWKMADMIGGNADSFFTLTPGITSDIVTPVVNPALTSKIDGCNTPNSTSIGLAKVIVTDSTGCIAADTYLVIDLACI